jgi:hypothetical protein
LPLLIKTARQWWWKIQWKKQKYSIVTGMPIHYFTITGYVVVLIQTYFTPKDIIALAYDSGGVTTSTVTVPLVAALGLGLASTIEGRNPMIDGFGLIAFASLFPIIVLTPPHNR